MKKKVINTLIATSIVTGTIANSTGVIVRAENNTMNEIQDYNGVDMLSRSSHSDIFPIKHSIMGNGEVSKNAFKAFLLSQQEKYGFKYTLTCSLDEWLVAVYDEAKIEGVRPDIVVAQAIKETGYFKFGGELTYKDNNFAGIGVTGTSGAKESFPTARIGIRAQVQHLKAYGSTDSLKQACVDPRFNLVTRGISPSLEELAGRWAYPGYNKNEFPSLAEAAKSNATYGQEIYKIINQAKTFENGKPIAPDVEDGSGTVNPEKPSVIAKGKVVGITNSLNVRSGPGTNFSKVGSLYNNQAVNICEKKDGWYKVEYTANGSTKQGYVSSKYISILEENNSNNVSGNGSKPENPNVGSGIREGIVTGISSRLNVRSGAGTNYSIITSITNNTKLKINSEKNGWYNVTIPNGKTGFVSAKYVKVNSLDSGVGGNTNEKPVTKKGKVTGITSNLRVRTGPGTSYSVITYLRNNENVEIIGEVGGWYRIKSSKSNTAYVSKEYIKLI
ncbi:MAG: SH3 domain-containing protein [Sarcina sp.]